MEIIKIAKNEEEVDMRELSERHIKKIARKVAEDTVYGEIDKSEIQLTKHIQAIVLLGLEGDFVEDLDYLLSKALFIRAETKEEYDKLKNENKSVYFIEYDEELGNYVVYAYDSYERKECIFDRTNLRKEIEWLATFLYDLVMHKYINWDVKLLWKD
jgi:hypothetical protein